MNQTNLQTLYRWLWPFRPDERDYNSETEDVIYNFTNSIDAVRGGMPNIFWEMLQSGHSRTVVETNNVLLNVMAEYDFANTDSVSDLSHCGIQIVGYGTGFSYLERDAKGKLVADVYKRQQQATVARPPVAIAAHPSPVPLASPK